MTTFYRVLALLAVAAALVGFGYVQGIQAEFDRHEERLLQIDRAAMEQTNKTLATIKRQKEINKENADAYSNALGAMRAHYASRLRNYPVCGSTMPSDAKPAAGTDERPADAGSRAEGSPAGLEAACAETTLQFLYLRYWVERQPRD